MKSFFFLPPVLAIFVFIAVRQGGNLWISIFFICGLPVLTFLGIGAVISLLDCIEKKRLNSKK